jgi:hypothetical protein
VVIVIVVYCRDLAGQLIFSVALVLCPSEIKCYGAGRGIAPEIDGTFFRPRLRRRRILFQRTRGTERAGIRPTHRSSKSRSSKPL